MKNFVEQISV